MKNVLASIQLGAKMRHTAFSLRNIGAYGGGGNNVRLHGD